MLQSSWDEIERIYTLPNVDERAIELFKKLKLKQATHTRSEHNLDHYCSFFVPYDSERGRVYLGDHIKAGGWIPPGGHIEPGETPTDAAIREMEEELGVKITRGMLAPFNLSVTVVDRPGCMTHYDVWHIVNIDEQPFDFDRSEYHDAGWFTIQDAVVKMIVHRNFAQIIEKLFAI